ncbi:ribonuclease E inhibitor RraA/Dimethylmenaquinone methyltransferase [Aspergillus egyptiacus]|nr:ribonuclease E inhibitor RraA/Dimethylmenaquinone methyltransferase [Aspergillus egyptiacus]
MSTLQEKLDILQNYSACDVSDALLKLQKPADGFPARAGHLADFSPISPSLTRTSSLPKLIAPASTITFIPKSSSPEPNVHSENLFPPGTHWVDNTTADTIVLIQQPPDQHCAVLGGIMALRMKTLGVKGVLVDGRVRDLEELHGCRIPVWARGVSTVGTGAEAKPAYRDLPVDVGGVVVRKGDIVFVDPLEGVVVIPVELLDEVLRIMPGLVGMDDKVKEAVGAGMSVFEAFKKFRG